MATSSKTAQKLSAVCELRVINMKNKHYESHNICIKDKSHNFKKAEILKTQTCKEF